MATKVNKLVEWMANGEINWETDVFSFRLSNAASPDMASEDATDIAELTTANGYTVGGQTLNVDSAVTTGDTTVLPASASAQTLSWTSTGTLAAYGGWIYDNTASRPVAYVSFGGQVSKTTGQVLAVYFSASLAIGTFDA